MVTLLHTAVTCTDLSEEDLAPAKLMNDRIANVNVVSIEIIRADGTRETILGTVSPFKEGNKDDNGANESGKE